MGTLATPPDSSLLLLRDRNPPLPLYGQERESTGDEERGRTTEFGGSRQGNTQIPQTGPFTHLIVSTEVVTGASTTNPEGTPSGKVPVSVPTEIPTDRWTRGTLPGASDPVVDQRSH